jgi:hypothetical protein
MKLQGWFSLLGLAVDVSGHAHLSLPRSRTQVAFENGQEYCPACVLEDVGPVGPSGRNYPGNRPFAEPGVSFVPMGPCGQRNNNNFNRNVGSWGGVVDSFREGEVIDVESCWSADHVGSYSIRICQDDEILRPFITRGAGYSAAQRNALEACFQRGVLPCSGVESNTRCVASPETGCQPGWGCWGRDDWFHSLRTGAKNDGRCGGEGSFYTKDQVQIPWGYTSNHTLLSWRWDALNTAQVYGSCADVAILYGGPTHAPTATPPTFAPTGTPTLENEPTAPPTTPPTPPPTTPPPTACKARDMQCKTNGSGTPCCAGTRCTGTVHWATCK